MGVSLCALLLGMDLRQRDPLPPQPLGAWPVSSAAVSGDFAGQTLALRGRGLIPMPANTPAAHASTLLPMPADHPAALMAFWFAGSRESGPDVQIAASQFERVTQTWSDARFVVRRNQGGRQRTGSGVRRLGNPVAWLDARGRIHLFVVATGWGGWAAGRIWHLRQVGDVAKGRDFSTLEFETMRVLPLSWVWNTSFLVRTTPLPLADGGMMLPAYFELGIKYPVALRFDAAGEFRGMVRISNRGHLLQPTLLMRSETDWLALMRDSSTDNKIKLAQTRNGGREWQDLPDLPLSNPDAAIAGLTLGPGRMVLAHNALPDSRAVLDLSASSDGLNWTRQLSLAQGDDRAEFSYPSLAWADDSLWVSYTDHRRAIAWQRLTLTRP
jgi:predicted neuraminidase